MLVHLTPGALAEVMAQPLCFPVCVESALEIRSCLAGGVCVAPAPLPQQDVPSETSASSGAGSSVDVTFGFTEWEYTLLHSFHA